MSVHRDQIFSAIGFAMLAFLAGTDTASAKGATILPHPAFAVVGDSVVSIPIGHAEFCRLHASECRSNREIVDAIVLTEDRWAELLEVNGTINSSVVPTTDQNLYQVSEFWTYPNGFGDCEDFVLAKRRALIDLGWEASTLLISVVRQENGEGHAVLMVRTDRGDLILDNQESLVKLWNETPYHYLKRQSQANAGQWVDFYDQRETIVASR